MTSPPIEDVSFSGFKKKKEDKMFPPSTSGPLLSDKTCNTAEQKSGISLPAIG